MPIETSQLSAEQRFDGQFDRQARILTILKQITRNENNQRRLLAVATILCEVTNTIHMKSQQTITR